MEQRIVKKGVIAGVDKNEVPTNWYWVVDRIITLDDGSTMVVPSEMPFTAEELATHVSAALAAQAADIARDAQERDALKAERDVVTADRDAKAMALAAALNELATLRAQ